MAAWVRSPLDSRGDDVISLVVRELVVDIRGSVLRCGDSKGSQGLHWAVSRPALRAGGARAHLIHEVEVDDTTRNGSDADGREKQMSPQRAKAKVDGLGCGGGGG